MLFYRPIFNILIFIIIYKFSNLKFATFWKQKVLKLLFFDSGNNSKWLRWLMYLSIIDEHIILDEFNFNWLKSAYDFTTKLCSSKGKILMKLNVWNEWFNGKWKHKINKLNNHFLSIKKKLSNFWIFIFASILSRMHFCMI